MPNHKASRAKKAVKKNEAKKRVEKGTVSNFWLPRTEQEQMADTELTKAIVAELKNVSRHPVEAVQVCINKFDLGLSFDDTTLQIGAPFGLRETTKTMPMLDGWTGEIINVRYVKGHEAHEAVHRLGLILEGLVERLRRDDGVWFQCENQKMREIAVMSNLGHHRLLVYPEHRLLRIQSVLDVFVITTM
jgi:hypothetical protein